MPLLTRSLTGPGPMGITVVGPTTAIMGITVTEEITIGEVGIVISLLPREPATVFSGSDSPREPVGFPGARHSDGIASGSVLPESGPSSPRCGGRGNGPWNVHGVPSRSGAME